MKNKQDKEILIEQNHLIITHLSHKMQDNACNRIKIHQSYIKIKR